MFGLFDAVTNQAMPVYPGFAPGVAKKVAMGTINESLTLAWLVGGVAPMLGPPR